eukprot:781842-Rhodomonas_salina.1
MGGAVRRALQRASGSSRPHRGRDVVEVVPEKTEAGSTDWMELMQLPPWLRPSSPSLEPMRDGPRDHQPV